MAEKISIGGQALIEGIMMKGKDKYSVAVRKPDGSIKTQVHDVLQNLIKSRFCVGFSALCKVWR